MKKIYYYTYKITCLKGSWKDRFYFGKHHTTNLNDNYFASGKFINDYRKKYGLENCIREILAFYNSEDELNKAEYDLIHPWLGNEQCLNICEGGLGCICYGEANGFYGKHHSDEQRAKWSEKRKNVKPSDETRQKYSDSHKGKPTWNKGKKGYHLSKPRSEEYKEKQRIAHLGKITSEETKKKQSESRLEYYKTHPSPNKGHTLSDEQKVICGNSTRGKHRVYDNPERTKWHMAY